MISTRDPAPPLLHCDIGPEHVLYDPRTLCLTGVIDFGDLVIGDPARDFIYIYEDADLDGVLLGISDLHADPASPGEWDIQCTSDGVCDTCTSGCDFPELDDPAEGRTCDHVTRWAK